MPQVYEPEFKRKLVRLHLEEGRSYKSLTQEYGVSKSAISKWVELFSNAGKDYPDAGYRSKPTGNVAERSDLTE